MSRLRALGLAGLVAAGAGLFVAHLTAGAPHVTLTFEQSTQLPGYFDHLTDGATGLRLDGCEQSAAQAEAVDPRTLSLQPVNCGNVPPGTEATLVPVMIEGKPSASDCRPESLGAALLRRGEGPGPVVLRYAGDCSTTRPLLAAASSYWVYDCSAGPNGRQGQIVQLSRISGAVDDAFAMPSVCYTSFAADDDGAFVASYDNPGPIYFAAAGAHHASLVLQTAGRVDWFFGVGDSVYADVAPADSNCAPVSCGIWRFDGSQATPHLVLAAPKGDPAFTPPTGDGRPFLYSALTVSFPSSYALIAIDTRSGTIAGSSPLEASSDGDLPHLAVADGSLFVLAGNELDRYKIS